MAKLALLIGVSEYPEGLSPLPAAAKDVEAVQQVLQAPEIGGFDRVDLLKNPDPQQMQLEIETLFTNCAAGDLVLLYFSGHGFTDEFGKFFFANRLTRNNQQGRLIKATAVPASFVHDIMGNSDSERQVLILDCCHSGAFPEGMTARDGGSVNLKQELGGRGRVILTSSTSLQYSFEQQGEELAVYTRYLVEGIRTGAADLDNDGIISVNELHDYVREKVRKAAPAMSPERYVFKEGEQILLCRAPIGDPRLKYRKEVERYGSNGRIFPAGRSVLDRKWKGLKLSLEEAGIIEAEVLKPFREHEQNLQEYEDTLREEVQLGFPISERARRDLKALQRELNLTDENVAAVQAKVTTVSPASPMPILEDLGSGITLELVPIPGGTFRMGSPKTEKARQSNEGPQHSVTVAPFYMGKFPITQAQWQAVAAFPKVQAELTPNPSKFKGTDHPVEGVSWHDAIEFCARLAKKTGRSYRLPSEAEWEYTCRAGTTMPFYSGETITPDLANYDGNYTYGSGPKGEYCERTTAVGSFPPNAFGLYDMHGNVWEWCQDVWHDDYNGAPANGSAWESGGDQSFRLLRGGSWGGNPRYCRSAFRSRIQPGSRYGSIGFRVVIS